MGAAGAIDTSAPSIDRSTAPRGQVAVHGYVPSGMSPEAYAAMKKKEEADRKKKQFGKGGAEVLKAEACSPSSPDWKKEKRSTSSP